MPKNKRNSLSGQRIIRLTPEQKAAELEKLALVRENDIYSVFVCEKKKNPDAAIQITYNDLSHRCNMTKKYTIESVNRLINNRKIVLLAKGSGTICNTYDIAQ